MKKFNQLLLLAALCSWQTLSSQTALNNKAAANPTSQLFKKYQVESVTQKMPLKNIADQAKKVKMVGMKLAAHVEELEKQCPFLQDLKPYMQLEGERKSFEEVGLKWETEDIASNWGFYVQRSLGDTNHFETVNFVWSESATGIKAKYRLPDKNDYDELSYYRLQLRTEDGTHLYSNIAEVKGYSRELFTLYPNPASYNLGLNITTKADGMATINVYDETGKLIQQKPALLMRGYNFKNLYVSNLLPGTYFINMIMADKTIRTAKFIKQ